MSTVVVRRLPDLAAAIKREHNLCERGYRTALTHAVAVGELLVQAKAQLDHGSWLPWVSEHTSLSARSAQQYMRLADASNAKALSHLGIEGALRAVASPKEEPPRNVNLRSAFGGSAQGELDAALAELNAAPQLSRFPASDAEREEWRGIHQALERITRFMDDASREGLSPWSRREALYEAARHARNASARLTGLGDALTA